MWQFFFPKGQWFLDCILNWRKLKIIQAFKKKALHLAEIKIKIKIVFVFHQHSHYLA